MNLHEDKEAFNYFVSLISKDLDIKKSYVIKDYFVVLLLKRIIQENSKVIFKGGTSLSKVWKVINRFSEDIDLTFESHPTTGERRNISHQIKNIISDSNMILVNFDDIKSKTDYNSYEISYEKGIDDDSLKENIIIETTYYIGSFPSEVKQISSYIYDFLKNQNRTDLIEKYELEPFDVRVQSLERTFIDKVFAICDYHLRNKYQRNSRHIYDLYKLFSLINMDENFKDLLENVRLLRRENRMCESAQEGMNINKILKEIIDTNDFRDDYNKTTSYMFFDGESLKYEEAITVLNKIIETNMF